MKVFISGIMGEYSVVSLICGVTVRKASDMIAPVWCHDRGVQTAPKKKMKIKMFSNLFLTFRIIVLLPCQTFSGADSALR